MAQSLMSSVTMIIILSLWLQADIDKFKKMQQTAQSNRSKVDVGEGSRPAADKQRPQEDSQALTQKDVPAAKRTSDPAHNERLADPLAAGSVGGGNTEHLSTGKQLPPHGAAKSTQGRRGRHMQRRKDPAVPHIDLAERAASALADDLKDACPGQLALEVQCKDVGAMKDQASLEGTRHGSFEESLLKLPRTRSHAKSESDLDRPHQVSVTADGAGIPVTRAIIGIWLCLASRHVWNFPHVLYRWDRSVGQAFHQRIALQSWMNECAWRIIFEELFCQARPGKAEHQTLSEDWTQLFEETFIIRLLSACIEQFLRIIHTHL